MGHQGNGVGHGRNGTGLGKNGAGLRGNGAGLRGNGAGRGNDGGRSGVDYDVAIVGASLAGSAAAILLARAGARVALIEKRSDPNAFKRVCGHNIQSSALATIERLGLLEPMLSAGAVRSRFRLWTEWGWITVGDSSTVPANFNLRREVLDPLVRRAAVETPGVELILGQAVGGLLYDDGRVSGVVLHARQKVSRKLTAALVIGADGRSSPVATLAGLRTRSYVNNRFSYGAYFEGPPFAGAPDRCTFWLTDPGWAAACATDAGQYLYGCMPAKDELPAFRHDPVGALVELMAALPDPPPIRESRQVGPIVGALDMPIIVRAPVAPGLALVGDAAMAADPLWGVGCGWALQSAEWLADSVAPALFGDEPLARGLARYRRRRAKALRGEAFLMRRFAAARPLNARQTLLMSKAVGDERMAAHIEAFSTRNVSILGLQPRVLSHALSGIAQRAIASRRSTPPSAGRPAS